jgi:hypothetical protein
MASQLHYRWRVLTFAGMAIAVVLLVAAPFNHHDLLCHLNTTLHCTTCTTSLLGSEPRTPAAVHVPVLAYAGSVPADLPSIRDLLLPVRLTGRSPPTYM